MSTEQIVFCLLVLAVIGVAVYFHKQSPLPMHGSITVPPQPRPFLPPEDELLKNQPPLATLVDDRLIETLPPPPQGKAKAPRSHHKKGG